MRLQAVRKFLAGVRTHLGLDVYSFSVFHVFFEQYLSIGRDAAALLTAAVLAITAIVLLFTGSLWAAGLMLLVLTMILVRCSRASACAQRPARAGADCGRHCLPYNHSRLGGYAAHLRA